MNNEFEFVLDQDGVASLLRGEEMRDLISSYVDEIYSGISYPGYESEVKDAGSRIVGNVWADGYPACGHEAKTNKLLISLGNAKQ